MRLIKHRKKFLEWERYSIVHPTRFSYAEGGCAVPTP